MAALLYVLWIGPDHWPIPETLSWLMLSELTIECLSLWGWILVNVTIRDARVARRQGNR